MKLEFTSTPNPIDINFLTQKIDEEATDFEPTYSFAFFMRDRRGKIIAGCNGNAAFGRIYTDQLWVHKEYRNKGIGRQLIDAVHEYGRKVGCHMATLSTMSFQKARSFYEKLGYSVDFERQGYAQGSSALFMKKEL